MTIKIPGYKITGTIGEGGMAEVFLAEQQTLHREIALKVLFPDMADDPQFGERFLRETQIIANLPHPNIVPVYDAGIEGKHYYLAMEYLKAGCLSDRIKLGVSLEDAIQYTLDIAEALAFAHAQGFIHRDIKPDNVLFRTQAKNAVLSDFGIARSTNIDNSLTQINLVIGTPKYMSPQQALGETLNEQSDIFSLGIILFEMLSGHTPYDAPNIGQLCIQHQTKALLALPPMMSILQPIIDKALAFELNDRYQNANSLIADLSEIQQTMSATSINNVNDGATVIFHKPAKLNIQPITAPSSASSNRPSDALVNTPAKSNKSYLMTAVSLFVMVLTGAMGTYFYNSHYINSPTLNTLHETKDIKALPLDISLTPSHAKIEIQTGSEFVLYTKESILPGDLLLKISAIGYKSEIIKHPHTNDQSLSVELMPIKIVSPQELLIYQKVVESKDLDLIDHFKQIHPESPFIFAIDYLINLQSIDNIRSFAEAGDVVARASLAEILDSPAINNHVDALYWSSLAAQENYPLGQTQYALMILEDSNSAGDKIDLAIRLLEQSAQSGFYLAKSSLAELYLMGKYVHKDLGLGIRLFKEAAELNDPYSYDALTKIYDAGFENIKPDPRLAKYYRDESKRLDRTTFQ